MNMATGGARYKQGIVAESRPGFARVRFDDVDGLGGALEGVEAVLQQPIGVGHQAVLQHGLQDVAHHAAQRPRGNRGGFWRAHGGHSRAGGGNPVGVHLRRRVGG